MDIQDIIIEPILTEKSVSLKSIEGKKQYTLKVDKRANKIEIKKAVRKLFKVEPLAINVVNVKGKSKSNLPVSKASYSRGYGKTSSWKKAIITLPAGVQINEIEGL